MELDPADGCFLYDFDGKAMHLIDLDEYRPGPFVVEGARLPGSTRYMAPEEFQAGATIDERTPCSSWDVWRSSFSLSRAGRRHSAG